MQAQCMGLRQRGSVRTADKLGTLSGCVRSRLEMNKPGSGYSNRSSMCESVVCTIFEGLVFVGLSHVKICGVKLRSVIQSYFDRNLSNCGL